MRLSILHVELYSSFTSSPYHSFIATHRWSLSNNAASSPLVRPISMLDTSGIAVLASTARKVPRTSCATSFDRSRTISEMFPEIDLGISVRTSHRRPLASLACYDCCEHKLHVAKHKKCRSADACSILKDSIRLSSRERSVSIRARIPSNPSSNGIRCYNRRSETFVPASPIRC